MAGSLSWLDDGAWPGEDGWPYSDADEGPGDGGADLDDDLVSLHALSPHLFDDLEPLERHVVAARFGLAGQPARSMKQLQHELGLSRADLRLALGDGLAKLRKHLG